MYGKYICIPYLQTLQCCTVVSKTAAGKQKLGLCPEIHHCSEVPSLTLPQLTNAPKPGMRYKVVLQYQHDEWSSVTNPGLLNIGLSSLTSGQKVVQAEMLLYMTATSPYYFSVVISTSTVLCFRLSTKVSKSALPVTLPFS